jgi:hypothetical protein
MLAAAGHLEVERPEVDLDVKGLLVRMSTMSPLELLGADAESSTDDIVSAYNELSAQVDQICDQLPPDASDLNAFRERMAEIQAVLADPAELEVHKIALAEDLDPDDPDTRLQLRTQALETTIAAAFEAGDAVTALPLAEELVAYYPEEPVAIAQLAKARLWVTEEPSVRSAIMADLIDRAKEYQNSLELQIIVAQACVEEGKWIPAKRALANAERLDKYDPRVVELGVLAGDFVEKRETPDLIKEEKRRQKEAEAEANKSFWTRNRKMGAMLVVLIGLLAAIWLPEFVPREGQLKSYGKPLVKGLSASLQDGYMAADGVFIGTLINAWEGMDKETRAAEVDSIVKKLAQKDVKTLFLYDTKGKMKAQVVDGLVLYVW